MYCCLTHWGWDKMAAIFQTTFSNAFSWMNIYQFRLKLHWSLFPRVQLTIFQHWFRWWFGTKQATRYNLNQWWLVYWCIYASFGLNELTHHGLVMPHGNINLVNIGSGNGFLTAPSHYLNLDFSLVRFSDIHLRGTGLILGLHLASERLCYKLTPSLIGWAQT